jgi:dTDP-glucose pyrophosphorylase
MEANWGVSIEYAIQVKPEGIAQSLIIAEEWLDGASSVLILGDNLFFGPNLSNKLKDAILSNDGATVFSYQVQDPERYGVLDLDDELNIINIEEKPTKPKSNWIVTGLYIYNEEASKISQGLKKSERGELEITDLNRVYLNKKNLKSIFLDNTYSWLDTGTHDSLLEASNFVQKVEKSSNKKVADLDNI